VVPPELDDEPLAQPATSEIATAPTAMAEIVLFLRIPRAPIIRIEKVLIKDHRDERSAAW
jgi:hypothetical protein